MIVSCLSLYEILLEIFVNYPEFYFILFSRFSQDALENVYSQLRRRAGQMPSILDCIRAFRLITLSQFVSNLKNTNYANDSDVFLVDFLAKKYSNISLTQPNTAFEIEPEDFHILDLPNDSSNASTLSSDLDILC